MLDKMNHINGVDDSLRRFVTLETRAGVNMSVNLIAVLRTRRGEASRALAASTAAGAGMASVLQERGVVHHETTDVASLL
jgi:proline racemase